MNRGSLAAMIAFAAVSVLPVGAQNASAQWAVRLNPRFGYFVSEKPVGVVGTEQASFDFPSATTVGLSVEAVTPYSWLKLRALGQTTISGQLQRRVHTGWNDCGPSCYAAQYSSNPTGRSASMLNLSADLLLTPAPSSWLVRPYTVAGVGLKRFDFGSGSLLAGPSAPIGGRDAGLAFNTGLGAEVRFGANSLTLEAVDYLSGFSANATEAGGMLASRAFDSVRHDLVVSVGLRFAPLGR